MSGTAKITPLTPPDNQLQSPSYVFEIAVTGLVASDTLPIRHYLCRWYVSDGNWVFVERM